MRLRAAIGLLLGTGLLAFFAGAMHLAHAAPTDLTVSANVLTKNQCKFRTNIGPPVLDFGDLDPLSGVDVTVVTSFEFRCLGSEPTAVYTITNDDGLYETGPGASRMQNTLDGAWFLPYTLVMSPTSGTVPKNVWQTLTFTGTVHAADYSTALIGPYLDLVVVTIAP